MGHEVATIEAALQSVALKFPLLSRSWKNFTPGAMFLAEPPLLTAAAQSADSAALADSGLPLRATSWWYLACLSADHEVGQGVDPRRLMLQPTEMNPPESW